MWTFQVSNASVKLALKLFVRPPPSGRGALRTYKPIYICSLRGRMERHQQTSHQQDFTALKHLVFGFMCDWVD